MVRRGQKKHLKRLPAPRHWPIKRKHGKFITRPIPGPHPKENSLTLAIVLREILGYAENMREVKAILSSGQVTVDGRIRKDGRYPVGLMDVIEIKNSEEKFRLLPKTRGGFRLVPIDDTEAEFKLCRIENKMMVSGGKVQLTLHDGRNILLSEDQKAADYTPLDTLKITIPDQSITNVVNLDTGAYAIVSQGKNVGSIGRIVAIEKRYGTHASTVTLQDSEGERLQTALDYVFVVGKDKPVVSLGSNGGSTE